MEARFQEKLAARNERIETPEVKVVSKRVQVKQNLKMTNEYL